MKTLEILTILFLAICIIVFFVFLVSEYRIFQGRKKVYSFAQSYHTGFICSLVEIPLFFLSLIFLRFIYPEASKQTFPFVPLILFVIGVVLGFIIGAIYYELERKPYFWNQFPDDMKNYSRNTDSYFGFRFLYGTFQGNFTFGIASIFLLIGLIVYIFS